MGKSTEKSKEKTTEKVKVKKDKSKSKSKSSSKRRKPDTTEEIPSTFSLAAPEKAIDSSLAALFGSSLGPVKAPKPSSRTRQNKDSEGSSETIDGLEVRIDSDEDESAEVSDSVEKPIRTQLPERTKKRKRGDEGDNLEGQYLRQLQVEEEQENEKSAEAREERESKLKSIVGVESTVEEVDEEDAGSGADDYSDEDSDAEHEEGKNAPPILHETMQNKNLENLDKSARTAFLGNVPSTAVSSKTAYKTLKKAFSVPGKIESIRFRSIAFSEQIPRKAAFVTHKLHEKQQTVNAYLVYKTKEAMREALKLNGTVVLDRHIRVDSIAHPAKQDTQKCVFIGNLDFEAQEDSLWRHFASCGKIESVRIIRDAKTNVGKGFAYVQFEDGVSVEEALLLDGKKMENDRLLRVSRAKNVKRKNKSVESIPRAPPAKKQRVYVPRKDPREKEILGRASKLLGRAGAAQVKRAPESFVFEGVRATSKSNHGVKLGVRKKGGKKPRTTSRSTSWKQKK